MPSALSWWASAVHSPGDRRRPSASGRSQARRTTWIATSGGKIALGTAAEGVREAIQALRQTPLSPRADDGPLHTNRVRHIGVGGPRGQHQDDFPPAYQPCRHGGRSLPAFHGLRLFGGEDNVS
jgi:hypothetical protein